MDRPQREINLLSSMFSPRRPASTQSFPAITLWSNEDSALATVEIPGVNIDDLGIRITGLHRLVQTQYPDSGCRQLFIPMQVESILLLLIVFGERYAVGLGESAVKEGE